MDEIPHIFLYDNSMGKNELKIEYLPVGDLKPYSRNARKHKDEDVGAIVASIKEFGFDDPIGIWSDKNIIVEGHGRLMAAKKLGMKEVPCIRLDHLTDEQRRAYALAHNKTAELSDWDLEALDFELGDIFDIDMEAFGFTLDDEEDEREIVEDEVPEDITEPIAATGDVWLLGRHRLVCGDSTDYDVIDTLMDGEEADMLLTDPPYNVDYEGKTKDALKIQNDSMADDDFRQFLRDAFSVADSFLRGGWNLLHLARGY